MNRNPKNMGAQDNDVKGWARMGVLMLVWEWMLDAIRFCEAATGTVLLGRADALDAVKSTLAFCLRRSISFLTDSPIICLRFIGVMGL